jgi:hypothetical protein
VVKGLKTISGTDSGTGVSEPAKVAFNVSKTWASGKVGHKCFSQGRNAPDSSSKNFHIGLARAALHGYSKEHGHRR